MIDSRTAPTRSAHRAYFTFFAELVGGAFILAGVYSRWVAAAQVLLGDGRFALANLLQAPNLPARVRA